MTGRDQRFDHRDHLRDMLGRARLDIWLQGAERRHILVEGLRRALGNLADRAAAGTRRRIDLVVHVGDVARIEHGRIAPLQQTVEHVEDDDRARIADMSEVVDGRSADIHPHTLRIDRFEYFLHPCQGVVQNQRHASSLQFFFRASGTTTPSRSEEHTSEIQSLMRNSYAVLCFKKKKHKYSQKYTK